MKDRSETETKSLLEEQGKRAERAPQDDMRDVPVLPTSAGVVLPKGTDETSTVDEDRAEAERRRERGDD